MRKTLSPKRLREKFESLIYQMIEGDLMEQVNFEASIYYRDFIGAGFDPVIIARLLSPEDLWDNYDELNALGPYVIDIYDLVYHLDKTFIEEHWNEIVERGISEDRLVDELDGVYSFNDIEKYLDFGVSPGKVYELSQCFLDTKEDYPDDLREIFAILCKYGLPYSKVKEWLSCHLADNTLCSIVEYDTEEWENLGIKASDYLVEWVYVNGASYFVPGGLQNLPELVDVDFLVKHMMMRDILRVVQQDNLLNFLQSDFLLAGGDVDAFAQKFIDEIGYSDNFDDFTAMLDLILAGATVIDVERLIEVIDLDTLSDFAKNCYWLDLSSAGADERLVNLFYEAE